jgi:hypothetical protein
MGIGGALGDKDFALRIANNPTAICSFSLIIP